MRRTGRSFKNPFSVPLSTSKSPSGLLRSLASLARNLLRAMPTEQVRCCSFRIVFFIPKASYRGFPHSRSDPLTSRNASSTLAGSTRSVYRLRMSITDRETCEYNAPLGRTKTAWGINDRRARLALPTRFQTFGPHRSRLLPHPFLCPPSDLLPQ